MATNERLMKAPADAVWDVLADGWLYPLWVVGASRMREVEDHWPAVGAKLHHSVGAWPMLLDDETVVEAVEPGVWLTLRAKARPGAVARVVLRLEPQGSETLVVIEEEFISGPAALIPAVVSDPLIGWRNVETLRRLAYVVERRAARHPEHRG